MKKSRFSEEQIARAAPGRKPHGSRGCVSPVGRERGHVLRLEKEFAHLSVSKRRRMRSLEEENTRVKHVVAAFEGAVARGALPRSITVDHGTEFTSKAVDAWPAALRVAALNAASQLGRVDDAIESVERCDDTGPFWTPTPFFRAAIHAHPRYPELRHAIGR